MAFTKGFLGRYTVSCDDPHHTGCRNTLARFGQDRTQRSLEEDGWYQSEKTGKFSCFQCVRSFKTKVRQGFQGLHAQKAPPIRTSAGPQSSTPSSSRDGDPMEAALIAMMLGGDPFDAGMAAWLSGSTSFGVLVGVMGGQHEHTQPAAEQPFDGSGDFGGAGASSTFDAPRDQGVPEPVSVLDTSEELPVIVDPDNTGNNSTPESEDFPRNAERETDVHDSDALDSSPSEPESSASEPDLGYSDSSSDTSY